MIDLINKGDKLWETEDGRGYIDLDDTFETSCDEPHPVRMSMKTVEGFSDNYRAELLRRGNVKGNYLSYYCEGNETHFYSQWVVNVDGDWTEDVYETFKQAVGALEAALGETIKIKRRTTARHA